VFDTLVRFTAPSVFNPWREVDSMDRAGSVERLLRLKQHFACRPSFLLVGEAPGYQGCRFSGVPFTSERLLLEGRIPRISCQERITSRSRPWSEPSATTVWKVLQELGIADRVVLWNAFPWHPHHADEPHSNRRPAGSEVRQGAQALRAVLSRFDGATVVAVGQVARQALQDALGLDPLVVRHPSMAGVREFRANPTAIAGRRRREPRRRQEGCERR